MATMIGSLPHQDPDQAIRLVVDHLHEAPIWPELPRRGFREEMIYAHTEALPGIRENTEAGMMFIDKSADNAAALAAFYETAMAAEQSGNLEHFALRPSYAAAFSLAAETFASHQPRYPLVKVHCVGPVSFQLGLKDEEDRPIYYDDTFADVLLRQVCLQTRWQVRRFRPLGDQVLAFLDEPSLAAFGSSGLL